MRFEWNSVRASALWLGVGALTLLAVASCTREKDVSSATPTALTTEAAKPGPPFAPNGRTSDAAIDAVIEHLLRDDARSLKKRYGDAATYEWSKQTFHTDIRPTADEWTSRLGSAKRSLYAVMRWVGQSPGRDASVILLVSPDVGESETWSFAVKDGNVIFVDLRWEDPGQVAAAVAWQYGAYIVLPPADTLPKPPPGRDLTVRSGDPGVDQILKALQNRDPWEVRSLIEYQQVDCRVTPNPECPADPSATPYVRFIPSRDCSGQAMAATKAEAWLDSLSAKTISVHAVADLPVAYEPAGAHLIIVNMENTPYSWYAVGLIESSGRIAGVLVTCSPSPAALYPPMSIVLPPPKDDSAPRDRIIFLPEIDALLQALNSGNVSGMEAMVKFSSIGCEPSPAGIGAPPRCAPDQAPGTPIAVIPFGGCEGHLALPENVRNYFQRLVAKKWSVYAVVDRGSMPGRLPGSTPRLDAVFVASDYDGPPLGPVVTTFEESKVAAIQPPCGMNVSPASLVSSGIWPSFLLPPP